MSSFVTKSAFDLTKIEPLNALNYRRWSVKMLIHFEAIELDYILTTNELSQVTQPTLAEPSQPETQVTILDATLDPKTPEPKTPASLSPNLSQEAHTKHEKENMTVREIMLHFMSYTLLDIYVGYKSTKVI